MCRIRTIGRQRKMATRAFPRAAFRVTAPWEEYKACVVQEKGSPEGKKACYEAFRDSAASEEE